MLHSVSHDISPSRNSVSTSHGHLEEATGEEHLDQERSLTEECFDQ